MAKRSNIYDNLLKALEQNLGIVTLACKAAGCDRGTYYLYLKKYPEFKKAADAIQEITIDFVESKLLNNIKAGDTTAMIFYLKTKGKDRGYSQDNNINVQIQPYNPNLITYEQRQELINESVKLLGENINNTVNNAEMIDYEEDVQNIIG